MTALERLKIKEVIMYRPEEWKQLNNHPCSGDGCLECRDYANREAGADAMLEGLLANGLKVNNLSLEHQGKGTVIFIPEEE